MRTRSIVTPILAAAVLAATTLSAGCVGWTPAKYKTTRQASIRAMTDTPIDVQTANGRVYVRESEGSQVVVDASLKLRTQERADAVDILAEYRNDGTLEVRVLWPDDTRYGNEACSFDIALPGASNVKVRSSNGSIEVTGLSGEADLGTSNGRVTVRGFDGDVSARTSNGRITVEGASGSVDAHTSNGSVHVSLTDDASGPVTIRSSNGSVEFAAGSSFEGHVSATTSNGSVRVSGDGLNDLYTSRRRAEFSVGDNDVKSSINTSNGSVTIRVSGG